MRHFKLCASGCRWIGLGISTASKMATRYLAQGILGKVRFKPWCSNTKYATDRINIKYRVSVIPCNEKWFILSNKNWKYRRVFCPWVETNAECLYAFFKAVHEGREKLPKHMKGESGPDPGGVWAKELFFSTSTRDDIFLHAGKINYTTTNCINNPLYKY